MIYFDNAATTIIDSKVLEAMLPFLKSNYGNASSIYSLAQESRREIEIARKKIAEYLNCESREIFFTSGGTESDNWATKSAAWCNKSKGKHIITSCIEHHAILHSCRSLEKQGFRVSYIGVDRFGIINLDELEKAICEETILISIMFANNEIGTIQPIEEIGKIARSKNIIFHTDAVQAIGNIYIDVNKFNIDMLSMSAHKFHGPKGIGALYINKNVKIKSFMDGGAQELNLRAGTENTAAIVGMGKAIEIAKSELNNKTDFLINMRNKLIEKILKNINYVRLNGHSVQRLVNNVNFSFEFIEGESLLLLLDSKGFCVSSGSACTSGSLDPSHVLLSLGLSHELAHGSLRITLSKYNKESEIDLFIQELPDIIKKLREMSPLYEDFINGKIKSEIF
ncbi:MAG: cysteine desulfurase NifS [Clostridiales bacterium]|nr:cysteine desulfurase NifS [Clostridiales bacterium]